MATTDGVPTAFLAETPAAAPPPGVTPDFYGHPATMGTPYIIVSSILVPIMLALVALRMYTKLRILRNAWWDDLTCGIAAFCVVFYWINMLLCTVVGHFGRHQWNISALMELSGWIAWPIWIENWLSTFTLMVTKCTFFLLYFQIFRPLKWLRIGIYSGLVFTIVAYLGFMIAQLALLTPHTGENWLQQYQDPREFRVDKLSVPLSAVSLGIDIYIFVFPMVGISQLQLSNRRKLGVMASFLTGFCACIASALSIYYKVVLNRNIADSSWYAMIIIITTLVEMCIGVSCTCMPSLAKWTRHMYSESKILHSLFSFSFMSLLTGRTTSKTSRGASQSDKAGFGTQTIGGSNHVRYGLSKPASTRGFAKVRESSDGSNDGFSLHATDGHLELGEVRTPRTFINSPSLGVVATADEMSNEENGIKVQKEVHQFWRSKK